MTISEPAGAGTAEEREIAAALAGLQNVSAGIKRESRERPGIYVDPKWAFIIDSAHEILASAITAAESGAMERCAKIAEAQPYYPDTNVGMRQQWVKDQIAATIRSSISPQGTEEAGAALSPPSHRET